MQRRKGAQFEREVAAAFQAVVGYTVKRHLGQARDGGEDIVVGSGAIVECKRRKSLKTLRSWYRQAFDAAVAVAQRTRELTDSPIPIVVLREDNNAPFVMLDLGDFLTMAGEWLRARPPV